MKKYIGILIIFSILVVGISKILPTKMASASIIDIKSIQSALISQGFLKAKADGIAGPLTTKAIESFQKAKQFKIDGQLDTQTLSSLGFKGATVVSPTIATKSIKVFKKKYTTASRTLPIVTTPSALALTSTNNGGTFTVANGQTFTVTLCNPGDGGYQFNTPQYNSSILSLTSHINVPLNPPQPAGYVGGCYGNDVFKFQALNTGTSTLVISASQGTTNTENMFSATIIVQNGATPVNPAPCPATTVSNIDGTTSSVVTPSVAILSPNGGESYVPGQQITVTWNTCGIPATDMVAFNLIEPQVNNQASFGLANTSGSFISSNDGQENILIPNSGANSLGTSGWPYGENYKIKIIVTLSQSTSTTNSTAVEDSSDNLFTINASSTPCSITSIQNPQLTVLPDSTSPTSQSISIGSTSVDLLHFKVRNNTQCDINLTGFNPSIDGTPASGASNQSSYWFSAMTSEKFFDSNGMLIGSNGLNTNDLSTPYVLPANSTESFVVKMDLPSTVPAGITLGKTTFRMNLGNIQATNFANQIINAFSANAISGFAINGNFFMIQ